MSADNWAKCPKCWAKAMDEIHQQAERQSNAYGKVPEKTWLKNQRLLWEKTDNLNGSGFKESFKENYQIGVDIEGRFSVEYRGRCMACDASFEYKYETNVKLT